MLHIYKEGLDNSLILGIFQGESFCGLAEIYGYRVPIRKASVGYRLLQEKWGKGIATEALRIMTKELLTVRRIEIITASTMPENVASARVLQKNGFTLVTHRAEEDWGYPSPTLADKWIL
ncbi:MAG: GNAT family N-acetyltransferase [Blautia sp.]|nr:GNAT family N-acetyltransferase [Blautia sp.]